MIWLLFSDPLAFFIVFGGLVLSLTVHEFAHAWMADHLGDPTPRSQGRLTLNPMAHLDPLGTIALLLTNFGWGKPVMFDPYNLREPRRDIALIAGAGPLVNVTLALVLSLLLKLVALPSLVVLAGQQLIFINLILAVFNLIPIPPLDGSKLILAFLPSDTADEYEHWMHRYSLFLLLILILPLAGGRSIISFVIEPIVTLLASFLL